MALSFMFVGIDVSKDRLDTLGPAVGLTVAFEASGGYERGVRQALLEANVAVHRVNPLRVRLYARSLGRNANNDRIDARLNARCAQAAETRPEMLDRAREQLAELVSHRTRLIAERTAIANRTEATRNPALCACRSAKAGIRCEPCFWIPSLVGTTVPRCDGPRIPPPSR